MSKKLIVLDAGHSASTFEKTGGKGVYYYENGQKLAFEEHSFNAKVVEYAKKLLEINDFDVLLTQPLNSEKEVYLRERTNLANKRKADLLISVHANAANAKSAKGHSSFYWHTSQNGKKLALIWDKYANEILKNPCRGVHPCIPGTWTNFHMTRETNMISILLEHAFFTNDEERKLLMSEEFQRKSAEVIALSVCEYYGVEFKKEEKKKEEKIVEIKPIELNKEFHIIKKGDTLYKLSRIYHLSLDEIFQLNPGIDAKELQIGQKINVVKIKETKKKFVLPSKTLRIGSKGKEVKQLQEALNELNFNVGVVDGHYGSKTRNAVLRFQYMFIVLQNDGIYGLNTKRIIESELKRLKK